MQQAKTSAAEQRPFTLYNDTGKPLLGALMGLMRRALGAGYAVVPSLIHDPIQTRAKRTRRGASVEVEIYGDGSGLELAYFGRVFILGVEARPLLAISGETLS